jgi:hypothetical protein
MFATNFKEKVGLWIPPCPLLCHNLIKGNHCVKNGDPALNDLQDIQKCGANIGGKFEDSWLGMERNYGCCEGYPLQVCEARIISQTMVDTV